MRITEKGQITIPIELREKFGFLPHTEIDFIEEKGRVYLVKKTNKKHRGTNIVSRLRGTSTVRMTTDQILELTRGKDERDTD